MEIKTKKRFTKGQVVYMVSTLWVDEVEIRHEPENGDTVSHVVSANGMLFTVDNSDLFATKLEAENRVSQKQTALY